ncbi:MAG: dTMP kinase [Sphingomonadaceae bacterium]|nr:dTMP kinase [Sphingomonadaceae bacterium]
MTGKFITFEGGEGAGKTTQIAVLASHLRALGINVEVTREPGGTTGGEDIRNLIVHGQIDRWSAIAEAFLVNAARADHVQRRIRPALVAGSWVLCDRYLDSTLAYQGFGKGVKVSDLFTLHNLSTDNLLPDCTIILDVSIEVAMDRIAARSALDPNIGLRFEAHSLDFHRSVSDGFRAVVDVSPQRCRLVDANGSVEQVADAVWAQVEPFVTYA